VIGDTPHAGDLRAWLRAAGVEPADSMAECWVVALQDCAEVDALLRPDDLAARPSLVIDATPAPVAGLRARERRLAGLGIECVDLACVPTADGQVAALVVGGDPAACDRARPWLDALARGSASPGGGAVAVTRVGAAGASAVALDCHRILMVGTAQAVAEARVLAHALEADVARVAAAMAGGFAASEALARLCRAGSPGGAQTGCGPSLGACSRDLGALLDEAHAAGCALPLTAVVAQHVGALAGSGQAHDDLSALGEALERLRARRGRQ
jgi:2-hydroxy-3-oxopropionate reductase